MRIRELGAADAAFLREMLCTALFWRSTRRRRLLEAAVLRHPKLAIYHRGWGRPGDTGYVAEDDGRSIGAVWYRYFTPARHGEGYVDPGTPELAVAVVRSRRGRGVGRALMEAIHERARADGVRRISLSVDGDNPARRLYSSLGYEDYEPDDGNDRMVVAL